ncbi:hypothetical protein L249_5480 [Ophiocordyceps polyrhachis-furcata BCC 54312]|uniref:Uncharacterized protein n=1 Tax=Ophiocordyceps polyrhachis-furcata BCC 54312 TaxID=1330021 RepID=A0A367LGI8_9HYPO|nr:hypothetical protein L249_5480 [Ophiocordyceps polyrhachis-furcata BCC 54312]
MTHPTTICDRKVQIGQNHVHNLSVFTQSFHPSKRLWLLTPQTLPRIRKPYTVGSQSSNPPLCYSWRKNAIYYPLRKGLVEDHPDISSLIYHPSGRPCHLFSFTCNPMQAPLIGVGVYEETLQLVTSCWTGFTVSGSLRPELLYALKRLGGEPELPWLPWMKQHARAHLQVRVSDHYCGAAVVVLLFHDLIDLDRRGELSLGGIWPTTLTQSNRSKPTLIGEKKKQACDAYGFAMICKSYEFCNFNYEYPLPLPPSSERLKHQTLTEHDGWPRSKSLDAKSPDATAAHRCRPRRQSPKSRHLRLGISKAWRLMVGQNMPLPATRARVSLAAAGLLWTELVVSRPDAWKAMHKMTGVQQESWTWSGPYCKTDVFASDSMLNGYSLFVYGLSFHVVFDFTQRIQPPSRVRGFTNIVFECVRADLKPARISLFDESRLHGTTYTCASAGSSPLSCAFALDYDYSHLGQRGGSGYYRRSDMAVVEASDQTENLDAGFSLQLLCETTVDYQTELRVYFKGVLFYVGHGRYPSFVGDAVGGAAAETPQSWHTVERTTMVMTMVTMLYVGTDQSIPDPDIRPSATAEAAILNSASI